MSDPRTAAIEVGAEALFANNASEWGPIAKTKKAVQYRDDLGAIYDAIAPLIRQATADEIAAALGDEAGRAGGPIFTKALEHAAELARRVGMEGGDEHE